MPTDTRDEEHERLVRRLGVMLGRGFILSDLEAMTDLGAAAVDAEADEFESGTHTLSDRWESYVGPARAVLAIMLAPATTEDERATARREAEEAFQADLRRETPEPGTN